MSPTHASTSTTIPGGSPTPQLLDQLTAKAGPIIAAMACLAYVLCIGTLRSLPMQDYANHVARAVVMVDLLFHHGARFGAFFDLSLLPVPYLLQDLLLVAAIAIFGPAIGPGVFTAFIILSLPAALLFYAHAVSLPRRTWPFLVLIGLFLATDWFFLQGFFAFRLGLALFIISYAVTTQLRERFTGGRFILHVLVLVVGLLTHLSALVFMVAAIGISAALRLWQRTTDWRRELALLAPCAVIFAWYFVVGSHLHESVTAWDYQAPELRKFVSVKIRDLADEFTSFEWHIALAPLVLFAMCLLLPASRGFKRARLIAPAVLEQWLLAAAFLGIYCILPSEYADASASYVDVRALPIVAFFLLFTCLRLPADGAGASFGRPWVLAFALALVLVNLLYIWRPLSTNDALISQYRSIARAIPAGSYVLPVHTNPKRPHLLHIGSNIVTDSGAITPYLFSRDNAAPMTYFSYKHFPYAPDQQWYKATGRNAPVDWDRIRCEYSYLLVTQPFDPKRIRVPTATVAANGAAALLAIDNRSCPARAE